MRITIYCICMYVYIEIENETHHLFCVVVVVFFFFGFGFVYARRGSKCAVTEENRERLSLFINTMHPIHYTQRAHMHPWALSLRVY